MSVHFSSQSDEWGTPLALFSVLNAEFGFTLDAAASNENHKCKNYFTSSEDALALDWAKVAKLAAKGGRGAVWLNPPYSRGLQSKFLQKARDESAKAGGPVVVCLIPARPDTIIWHKVCFPCASEIRFIKGRVHFTGETAGPAPFPSALVIFGQDNSRQLVGGWSPKL